MFENHTKRQLWHIVAHHKHPSRGSTGVAVLGRATVGLVVISLLSVVEGVVVQGMHQVGVHVTEEHANLWGRQRRQTVNKH